MSTKHRAGLTAMMAGGLILAFAAVASAQPFYDSYFLYLGNHPSDANPGWHEDVQGIAHDDRHWIITQTGTIWRIPVWHDLNAVSPSDPGVMRRFLSSYPQLVPYDHLG